MKALVWHGRKDIRVEDVPNHLRPRDKSRSRWRGAACVEPTFIEYMGGPLYIPVDKPIRSRARRRR